MPTVHITGWREGLNKVALNELIRQHAGHGLRAAKETVDDLLLHNAVSIEFPTAENAEEFCRSAEAIGVVCMIDGNR